MTRVHDRLLHLGNIVVDLVLDVPKLPERGGDTLAGPARTTPGGGFNVMVAAARQGLDVAYGGAHGTGPLGDQSRAAMLEAGIDVLLPPKPDLDTGLVVTLVDAEGERTFVTSPGAEATLDAADLAGIRPGAGDLVYLSGYSMLHPANRTALTTWLGTLPDCTPVAFDPGPLVGDIPADTLRMLLARVDWWSCNAREAAQLTGQGSPGPAAEALAGSMARGGALVRTGPDGCHIAPSRTSASVHVPGFVVRAVDLNGAGDAHTGTFLAVLAGGSDPVRAARTANAAAALAVTAYGPATAPDADRLNAFLSKHA
ncbi:sugar/nucleoside kinase (ribokinase family) [Streptomyces sp. 846.5]|nr:PfkB family carbohydrate kinase [Streptomyces sp. 846.5]TDU02851.1 sugar/nucleoside kinase (ribokinase family) [Streptomyces sp. 846.5]